jgi:hypothetical protein
MAGRTLASARAVRITFLTTLLPGSGFTGSEVATQSFVDALRAAGHETTLLAYRRAGTDPPRGPHDVAVADRHIETRGAGLRPLAWMAHGVLSRRPYTQTKFMSSAYRRAVAARRGDADLVVIDHARMGWLVPDGGFAAPFAYLAHNVEHRLYADLAAGGGAMRWANAREARMIRRAEERLCAGAAQVWTLTDGDAEALAPLGARETRVFGLPPSSAPGPPGPASFDVGLLGSWTWRSNAAGLEWFVDEVAQRLDGLDVHVGGADSDTIAGGRHGITARGRVPDAMEFLQDARVIACPSVAGAGVQIKTLDAIATGRPVVATPIAARGLDDLPPTVAVAGEPEAFAAALRDALRDGVEEQAARTAAGWVRERRRGFESAVAGALADLERSPA